MSSGGGVRKMPRQKSRKYCSRSLGLALLRFELPADGLGGVPSPIELSIRIKPRSPACGLRSMKSSDSSTPSDQPARM